MMKSTTPINNLTKSQLRQISKIVQDFCQQYLGVNNRHLTPIKISIKKSNLKKTYYGQYEPYQNKITLFWNNIPTVEDFIHTLIHEWVHYLQPIKTKYYKLLDEFGYEKHPFEKEADRIADELIKPFKNFFYKNYGNS